MRKANPVPVFSPPSSSFHSLWLTWVNGKSEPFVVSFFALGLVSTCCCYSCCLGTSSINHHSWLTLYCKGKLRFCCSGSVSLILFQGLPPGTCSPSFYPPLYPHGLSSNLKLCPEASFLEQKELKPGLRPGLTQW